MDVRMKSFHARVKILVLNEKKVRFDSTNLYIVDKSNTLAFLATRLVLPTAAIATNFTRKNFYPSRLRRPRWGEGWVPGSRGCWSRRGRWSRRPRRRSRCRQSGSTSSRWSRRRHSRPTAVCRTRRGRGCRCRQTWSVGWRKLQKKLK